MKINASPETVRNTTEALKLAALLDDRLARADDARIIAWAEKLEKHKLTRDDILDGLQAFYDNDPHARDRAIGIADLIHHARIVKRHRLDKEDEIERDRRRAEWAGKAAPDEVQAIASAFVPGKPKKTTPRLEAAAAAMDCCHGREESMKAMREFFEAKAEAMGRKRKAST